MMNSITRGSRLSGKPTYKMRHDDRDRLDRFANIPSAFSSSSTLWIMSSSAWEKYGKDSHVVASAAALASILHKEKCHPWAAYTRISKPTAAVRTRGVGVRVAGDARTFASVLASDRKNRERVKELLRFCFLFTGTLCSNIRYSNGVSGNRIPSMLSVSMPNTTPSPMNTAAPVVKAPQV